MAKIIKKEEANILFSSDPNFKKEKKQNKQVEVTPQDHILSIRIEKKGRGGKSVTVIYDFPENSEDYFKKLTKKLKRVCGSGGTYKVSSIEVQGDHREKIKDFLNDLGFKSKFTGG